ncbi:hypothetical protein FEDK69T_04120 [Flavobacterium enshiense DK69]|nr:hypothetical protein FEDK69T_04120 [Flavobacterium enshiense DK69]
MSSATHFIINHKAHATEHFLFVKVNIFLLKEFPNSLGSTFVKCHKF